MPELVVPPGYAQGILRWRVTDDPEEMIVTIGLDVSEFESDPDAAASKLAGAWTAGHAAASFYVGWTFVGATVRYGSDGGTGLVGERIVNLAGTAVGETPPQNVAVLAQKLTGLAGRRNKGRMYFPPAFVSEAAINKNGVIQPASLTAIQTGLTSFFTELTVTAPPSLPPVLFHSEAPTVPTPITQFLAQAVVATQRTRLRR